MTRTITLPIRCSTVKTVNDFAVKATVFLVTLYATLSGGILLYLAAFYNGLPAPFPFFVQMIGFVGFTIGSYLTMVLIFGLDDNYRQYVAPLIIIAIVCYIVVSIMSHIPTFKCIPDEEEE